MALATRRWWERERKPEEHLSIQRSAARRLATAARQYPRIPFPLPTPWRGLSLQGQRVGDDCLCGCASTPRSFV